MITVITDNGTEIQKTKGQCQSLQWAIDRLKEARTHLRRYGDESTADRIGKEIKRLEWHTVLD